MHRVPRSVRQAASCVKSTLPSQPPLQVPGAGVTSSFARTAPVTPGGATEAMFPCHTGLSAVAPALDVARNTVSAAAPDVVTICPFANGPQFDRSGAQASQDHVSSRGLDCE